MGYITMKNIADYENSHIVNLLYFIIGKTNGYTEESNRNKYLVLVSTDKDKEILTKYEELWNKIKTLIEKINDKPGKYGKDFMKIKFNSDDNLSLNKILKIHSLTVIVRPAFEEDIIYKLFVWVIKLMQYERIDIWNIDIDIDKSGESKRYIICHYWHFKDIGYKVEPHVCNKCHDISMMAHELKTIAILIAKYVDYKCVLWNMTKNDTINRLANSKLDDKDTFWKWIFVQTKHLLK